MAKTTKRPKYVEVVDYIKKRIQIGTFPVDSLLPSEHELCQKFSTTRTTVRRALEELLKEGFIQKEQGRGSKVLDRSKSLGLLTVKGFSGAIDHNVKTVISVAPSLAPWPQSPFYALSDAERYSPCIYFQRIRKINDRPIVVENNWYAENRLERIKVEAFVEGSFFKTLRQKYLIEVMGAEQELRSVAASAEMAHKLDIEEGAPILHIKVRFRTSREGLYLYGDLYCNTQDYPIRNSYFI
jgi:DNA-binding GntR family transcriptional regulator